jgi:hypothetical protein
MQDPTTVDLTGFRWLKAFCIVTVLTVSSAFLVAIISDEVGETGCGGG